MKSFADYTTKTETPPIQPETQPPVVDPPVQPESPSEESETVDNPNLSIKEMIDTYLFGIALVDPHGNPFPQSLMASYINSAVAYAESLFDISLTPIEVEKEYHDYERNDYTNWGYMQLWKRPIREITSLRLMYGSRPSFEIPLDWLKIDKNGGKVQMFPASGTVNSLIISQGGAIYGLHNMWDYAPQMWEVDYKAGMAKGEMPAHLKELIYKKAVIGTLQVWGDLILGAGIASQSVSIDGLSQSIGTTQSAMYGGASARCTEYRNDIDALIPIIRQQYAGIRMTVL